MTNVPVSPTESIAQYLTKAAAVAQEVFARYPKHALDEQAGPAYLQGFALSRWIFWQRLRHVVRLLPTQGISCLDFGCGFGLLLPLLQHHFHSVYGVDLRPDLATQFLQVWGERYGGSLDRIHMVNDMQHHGLCANSLDVVLALDVLEHIDALPAFLSEIERLLKPGGILIVTGPTENWVYRMGRWLVGFSGDYHVRSIYDIHAALNHCFHVERVGRIFYPFTLFHLLKGTPRRLT